MCMCVCLLSAQVDEEAPMRCPRSSPLEQEAEKQALCPDRTEVEAETHHLQVLWPPCFLPGFDPHAHSVFPAQVSEVHMVGMSVGSVRTRPSVWTSGPEAESL